MFVVDMMRILETDKVKIGLTPEEAKVLCLSHANRCMDQLISLSHRATVSFTSIVLFVVVKVFSAGDAQDKSGLSDKGTAKIFYTASIFYDILSQFGDVEAEVCR